MFWVGVLVGIIFTFTFLFVATLIYYFHSKKIIKNNFDKLSNDIVDAFYNQDIK